VKKKVKKVKEEKVEQIENTYVTFKSVDTTMAKVGVNRK
jgi:hypothetical protein